jgi:KipI family sensor histidine kinase inhibitor
MVELPGLDQVVRLHAALVTARERGEAPGVQDLVPAERTLLVRFDPRVCSLEEVRTWVAGTSPAEAVGRTDEEIELPVRYDGEDLADVGRLTGLGPDGVVAAHSGRSWTVAFAGFAPGFGYLVGGDERLRVPRLASPRVRVPAGAVALAGHYSAVYPRVSPGGWRLIGHTVTAVWDLGANPPALLRPGARVRFVPVDDR